MPTALMKKPQPLTINNWEFHKPFVAFSDQANEGNGRIVTIKDFDSQDEAVAYGKTFLEGQTDRKFSVFDANQRKFVFFQ